MDVCAVQSGGGGSHLLSRFQQHQEEDCGEMFSQLAIVAGQLGIGAVRNHLRGRLARTSVSAVRHCSMDVRGRRFVAAVYLVLAGGSPAGPCSLPGIVRPADGCG